MGRVEAAGASSVMRKALVSRFDPPVRETVRMGRVEATGARPVMRQASVSRFDPPVRGTIRMGRVEATGRLHRPYTSMYRPVMCACSAGMTPRGVPGVDRSKIHGGYTTCTR